MKPCPRPTAYFCMVFSNVANSDSHAVVPKNKNPASDQVDVCVFRKKLYLPSQAFGKRNIIRPSARNIYRDSLQWPHSGEKLGLCANDR